jgi:phosphatidylethanolamine-binding protein (PEBP) family uncharacterized protein
VRISCSNTKSGKDSKGFTVALTDPDAPSRKHPEWSEICHWIVTIPGNAITWQGGEDRSVEMHLISNEIVECKTSIRSLSLLLIGPRKPRGPGSSTYT